LGNGKTNNTKYIKRGTSVYCDYLLVDNSPNPAATVGGKANCIVCQKLTTTIPINRATRSDVLVLFRPPKDVLTEYSPKFIKTLDFQQKQYQYVMKHFNEKVSLKFKHQFGYISSMKFSPRKLSNMLGMRR
jgi:hypothetical protein